VVVVVVVWPHGHQLVVRCAGRRGAWAGRREGAGASGMSRGAGLKQNKYYLNSVLVLARLSLSVLLSAEEF
jgi:hypothetical protein